jgi:hypothetical protein
MVLVDHRVELLRGEWYREQRAEGCREQRAERATANTASGSETARDTL